MHNDIYLFMVSVTVNGAEVGRLPQSELSILASIKEKSKVTKNIKYKWKLTIKRYEAVIYVSIKRIKIKHKEKTHSCLTHGLLNSYIWIG